MAKFGDDPNAPVVVNNNGGKQTDIPVRMDLIPARELLELGKILKVGGDKYGDWNWLNIPVESHLNHALHHAYAFLTNDERDFDTAYTELMHCLCRMMFAATRFRMDYGENK